MATSTIKATNVNLTSFINVRAIGTKITLSESFKNFKAIAVRLSSDTDQTTGGGAQYAYIPTHDSLNQFGVIYALNSKLYTLTVKINSPTEFEIVGAYNLTDRNTTMGGGIRRITGIN